jgi:Beta-galactosidase
MNFGKSIKSLFTGGVAAIVMAGALASPATAVSVPAADAWNPVSYTVPAQSFGIHSFQEKPLTKSGALRQNCYPQWRQMEPSRGKYDWSLMDAFLYRASIWGYKDIMFTFCGTPVWASKPVKRPEVELPDPGDGSFGAQSTAPPTNLADWQRFVRAFVTRYRSKIANYQVWNEGSSVQFWQGTPTQMADMTKIVNTEVKRLAPKSKVLATSTQTHRAEHFPNFFVPYLKALKARKWPVDVFTGHFYGPNLATRTTQMAKFKAALKAAGAPASKPRWDTESNLTPSTSAGGAKLLTNPDDPTQSAYKFTGAIGAAYTARIFLDSMRNGISRTYWYTWTPGYSGFPGILMGAGQPSGRSMATLYTWTVGSKYTGCKTKGNLVTCSFKKGSKTRTIAWSQKSTSTLRLAKSKSVCPVYGKCATKNGNLKVTYMPVSIL